MTALILYTEDSDEGIVIPHKWVICRCCEGEGKSSAYLGAYTEEEMDDAGPDFHDDYMAGYYDRTCDTCGGEGKVKVPDLSKMPEEMRKSWEEQEESDREIEAISAAERRMGA